MKISEIFEKKPTQWGLRGDPYLWRELKESFKETEMPDNAKKLEKIIIAKYEKVTGLPLSHQKTFVVSRFKHGGMSSGGICPDFWINTVIPLLVSRYVEI